MMNLRKRVYFPRFTFLGVIYSFKRLLCSLDKMPERQGLSLGLQLLL